eukprot:TRINITY_DN5379_c0_g1_i1.p1 TRINITY_DN5379_c0_g1~~TRINITY_DN5379_c0_g1_i1.p1  ORF type:complete len:411 (+),score=70.39 TRINITY_DN5379_c0_g1_i1:160-1392(+)
MERSPMGDAQFLKALQMHLSKKRESLPARIADKIDSIMFILKPDRVNNGLLRSRCFNGIPEDLPGLRPLCWKIIMGYLSSEKTGWDSELHRWRQNYRDFLKEFILPVVSDSPPAPPIEESPEDRKKVIHLPRSPTSDHPLNVDGKSNWKTFFEDLELWDMIEKDTKRTRSDMNFFLQPTRRKTTFTNRFSHIPRPQCQEDLFIGQETHNEVLLRILFIYAKLNSGVSYVQGMNEVLAPIYFCFSNDSDEEARENAEADSFWCFLNLMAEIKDAFVKGGGTTSTLGIQERVRKVHVLLEKTDKELKDHFEREKVDPIYYCLRWVMLLFTQEFELGLVMTVWDSILSHDNKLEYVLYISAAILMLRRDELLQGEFAEILENLKKIGEMDVYQILIKANDLYASHYGSPSKLN